jgi:hypothetical protein
MNVTLQVSAGAGELILFYRCTYTKKPHLGMGHPRRWYDGENKRMWCSFGWPCKLFMVCVWEWPSDRQRVVRHKGPLLDPGAD